MQGMSERQYAARVGLSRGAIQKAKAAGRLVLHEDGSIDAAASDKRRSETTDPFYSKISTPMNPARQATLNGGLPTLRKLTACSPKSLRYARFTMLRFDRPDEPRSASANSNRK